MNRKNRDRLSLYLNEVNKLEVTVLFAGRLGDCVYYNIVLNAVQALGLFKKEIANPNQRVFLI
ncbi:MAG: hypothetical protein AAF383_21945 [Cyanobacteria bacterium P01_A01_bin.83]